MSENKEYICQKGSESSTQDTGKSNSIEMAAERTIVSESSSVHDRDNTGDNISASTELKQNAQFNAIDSEKLNVTRPIKSAALESEKGKDKSVTESDFLEAIDNIQRLIHETQIHADRYSNKFVNNIIKPLLSKHSEKCIHFSNDSFGKVTSSEFLSGECTEDTDETFPCQNPLEMAELNYVSSDCPTPTSSTDICTTPSSARNSDASTGSFFPESLWVNKNLFFYSPTTLKIREHYEKLFDFEEFRHASSLGLSAYQHNLSIKYIILPITRFLVEELLDFVDFINGTERELREPKQNARVSTSEERQLAFVRDKFPIGVQQHESRTFRFIFKQANNFIAEAVATGNNSIPLEIFAKEYFRFYGIKVNTGKQGSKQSSSVRKLSAEKVKCRFQNFDPKNHLLEWHSVTDRLEYLKETIKRSVWRCISDTKMVVDLCIESKHGRSKPHLKSYFLGVKCMLDRLFMLREDCVVLLEGCDDPIEETNVRSVLIVKVQVATVFLELLLKLLEVNSNYLETIYI